MMTALRPTAITFGAATALGLWLGWAGAAVAHPHVWVTVELTVIYEQSAITGIHHKWTFDEFYTSMAIQGLDANNDGVYDRAELAELAKVNMEGLKEFKYFTFAKLGDAALALDVPTTFWMAHAPSAASPAPAETAPKDKSARNGSRSEPGFWSNLSKSLTGKPTQPEQPKVLSLEFTVPLQQPVLAEAEGFSFAVYDPALFIWFDLAKDTPVRLGGAAPPGCKATVGVPAKDAVEVQGLNEAFFNQVGGQRFGAGLAKSVMVSCPKS